MTSADLKLDHAVLDVGGSFDDVVATLEAAGFHVSPESSHKGMRNRRIYFSNTYLTLLQKTDEASAAPRGVVAVAFKGQDLEALAQSWHAGGAAQTAPVDLSRDVLLDGVARTARFRTLDLPEGSLGEMHGFVCHHLTPKLLWRPEWQAHENGAVDLVDVVVAASEPGPAAQSLARYVAAGKPIAVAGGFQTGQVSFLAHDDVGTPVDGGPGSGVATGCTVVALRFTASRSASIQLDGIPVAIELVRAGS